MLTQLNAGRRAHGYWHSSAMCNGITLPPFDANTTMRLRRPHPVTVDRSYRSRHHNCHTSTLPIRFTHPISCNAAQRKCLEIVQYRVKFSKSSISLSSRHGLREGPERADGDGSPGSREGTTRLSDVLRRSTLSARTTRTPAAARDSIRANFGRPMKTEGSFGMWRKKSIIIRLAKYVRGATLLRIRAQNT